MPLRMGRGRHFVRSLRRESQLRLIQPTKRAYLSVNGWDRRQSKQSDFRLACLLTVASYVQNKLGIDIILNGPSSKYHKYSFIKHHNI